MSTTRRCRACEESFEVAEGVEDGDDGECPDCRSGRAAPLAPERITAAFRGAIPSKRPSWSYRLWILIVAGVMITLPLIYLGIVASACYAMYWHATRDYVVFQRLRNGRVAVMVYFGPLIVLGVLIFFLAKPLFARRGRRSQPRSLRREEEPALFALVDGVCKAVGAPKPVRIDVDCNVNASAGPEHGLISLIRRRLVLTIGLPLVATLDAQQFAGVLAHEFGHFGQSAGMKVTYVIRSINAWFSRVVYERDQWDATLDEWSSGGSGSAMVIGNVAQLVVWATRRILWILMHVGHAVSCTMSRQMEFDADRCQALLVGSPVVGAALRRLNVVAMAHQGAMADLAESWKAGRLPDDLPRLIEANIVQIPEELLKGIDARIAEGETNVFDTHPSDKDRIAAADAWRAPGVFHLDGLAAALFRDFDALSRECTARHYQAIFGEAFSPDRLRLAAEVVRETERLRAAHDALGRVLQGEFDYSRTVHLPADLAAGLVDPVESKGVLERIRGEQRAGRVENDERLRLQAEALEKKHTAEAAAMMLESGFELKFRDYPPSPAMREALEREIAKRASQLERFDALCAERIVRCLSLLEDDGFAGTIDGGDALRREARKLYPLEAVLGDRIWPAVPRLVEASLILLTILEHYEGNEQDAALRKAIFRGVEPVRERIAELRTALGKELLYPFDHAKEGITLDEFAFPTPFEQDDVMAMLRVSQQAVSQLSSAYVAVLGRLALAVEKVEDALGLQPLAIDESSGDNRPAYDLASSDTRAPS